MKHVERAIEVLAVLSALFALAFVLYAYGYAAQNPVASEIAFEAHRVARGFPLYVDPWKGAWELGAPPSRYYVLYTPIFPTLIGKLTAVWCAIRSRTPDTFYVQQVGRTVALLAWLGFHVPVVVFAPKDRRRVTMIAAMLGASVYFVARHGPSMSPDTLATALVCGGVLRAVIKDEIDPLAAVLLIAGPFVKPSCLGGVAGAALVVLAQRRPGWWKGLAAGLVTFVAFIALCHVASDGAWLSHIKNSTGQPLTLTRWGQEMGSRIFVLGLPHAVVAWLAYRRKTTWLVLGPLLGSIAWSTFMMAKHGSGSHYWFEPTGLALIAISRMPPPTETTTPKWIPLSALVYAVLVAVTSWPQFAREPKRVAEHEARIRALQTELPIRAGNVMGRDPRLPAGVKPLDSFIMSSDFEIESRLNFGQISVPAWQSGFLARAGKFPKEEWQKDLARPEVWCVVLSLDPRLPPAETNDAQVELSPYYDILKAPLLEHFEYHGMVGGMFVFKNKREY